MKTLATFRVRQQPEHHCVHPPAARRIMQIRDGALQIDRSLHLIQVRRNVANRPARATTTADDAAAPKGLRGGGWRWREQLRVGPRTYRINDRIGGSRFRAPQTLAKFAPPVRSTVRHRTNACAAFDSPKVPIGCATTHSTIVVDTTAQQKTTPGRLTRQAGRRGPLSGLSLTGDWHGRAGMKSMPHPFTRHPQPLSAPTPRGDAHQVSTLFRFGDLPGRTRLQPSLVLQIERTLR